MVRFLTFLIPFSLLLSSCGGSIDPNFHPGYTPVVSNGGGGSGGGGGSSDPAPTVTSLDITTGPLAGGTNVTLTGTGFLSGATVSFGGSAGTSVSVINSTTITVTTPSHSAGTVNVVVTNSDSQSGTLTNGYTYQAAPTVTSLSVSAGALAGSTSTTITGTGFLSGATVSFGGSAGTSVSIVNATTITVTTPSHSAGAVNVVVTNSDSQSGTLTNGYTYQAAPTVTSLSVATGSTSGGTSTTITGTGFISGASVTFGGSAGTSVTVVNATTITVTTPSGSIGAVNIIVTNSDSQSGTLTNGYTYIAGSYQTVFLTTGTYDGNLGSFYGADFRCQLEAVDAGLSGTWRAIVGGFIFGPSATVAMSTDPIYDTQGNLIAANKLDFWANTYSNGILYSADGTSIGGSGVYAWTGSSAAGGLGQTCNSWSNNSSGQNAAVGQSNATTSNLVSVGNDACNTLKHLYCINGQSSSTVESDPATFSETIVNDTQITFSFTRSSSFTHGFRMAYTTGNTPPSNCTSGTQISSYTIGLNLTWTVTGLSPSTEYSFRLCSASNDQSAYSTGLTRTVTTSAATEQLVFLSSTTTNGNMGGVAGANAICQADADANSLGGIWKAILSGGGIGASTRISITLPIYDMQGNLVANNSTEFWNNTYANPIVYGPDGSLIGGASAYAWTGSSASGGAAPANCTSWTVTGLFAGRIGQTNQTNSNLIYMGTDTCDQVHHLYCINGQTNGGSP